MFGRNRENQNAVAVINPNLKKLHEFYTDAVRDRLGCVSTIDSDGHIKFKYGNNGWVLIACDEKDLPYFHLVEFIKLAEVNDVTEKMKFKALKAINACSELKCSILSMQELSGDWVLLNSIEAFLAPSGQIPTKEIINGTLERYMSILVAARQKFVAELEKLGGLE